MGNIVIMDNQESVVAWHNYNCYFTQFVLSVPDELGRTDDSIIVEIFTRYLGLSIPMMHPFIEEWVKLHRCIYHIGWHRNAIALHN